MKKGDVLFTVLGWTVIGGAVAWGAYPAFESIFLKRRYSERKLKENLTQSFINAELFKRHGNQKELPIIMRCERKQDRLLFVFSVPKGISPDKFERLYSSLNSILECMLI